jgi:hypothetical protein
MADILIHWFVGYFLWGTATVILIICGGLYLYRGNQKEDYKEKLFMHGFAYIFIFSGFSRIIFALSESINYYNLPTIEEANLAYNLYVILNRSYYVVLYAGITLFVYTFEKVNKRTKYVFTIMHLLFLGFMIIGPYGLVLEFLSSFLLYFDGVLASLIFLVIIKWSQFEFKAISSLLLQGYILMLLALGLYTSSFRYENFIFSIIPPILTILGSFVIMSPMLIEPKRIKRAFRYWIFLSVLGIGLTCYLLIYFLILGSDAMLFIINVSIFLSFLIFSFILVIKVVKTQPSLSLKKKPLDILQTFSRPPKFSEEEITFYREKQMCVVCKNKVSRKLYLCPDCNVLYCEKCADVLTGMENACWVCDTPFDDSKPVKLLDKEEAGVVVKEEVKKKGKGGLK